MINVQGVYLKKRFNVFGASLHMLLIAFLKICTCMIYRKLSNYKDTLIIQILYYCYDTYRHFDIIMFNMWFKKC